MSAKPLHNKTARLVGSGGLRKAVEGYLRFAYLYLGATKKLPMKYHSPQSLGFEITTAQTIDAHPAVKIKQVRGRSKSEIVLTLSEATILLGQLSMITTVKAPIPEPDLSPEESLSYFQKLKEQIKEEIK